MAATKDISSISRKKWTDGATQRVNDLRDQYWRNKPEIDTERARVYTRVYKENEAEDVAVKRAKALHAYVSEKTITIGDNELIVGTEGKKHRSAVLCPDICFHWLEDEMDTVQTRPQDPYILTDEDKKLLKDEIFPYWSGRSMEDYFLANMDDELKNVGLATNIVFGDIKSQSGGGEWAVGYHNIILKKGFRGVQKEAEEYLEALDKTDPDTWDKAKFYEAVIITCDAARILGQRYADKAREMASSEIDSRRKAELERIAVNCSRVPYEPPETFEQAIQAVWLTQILIWAEENQQAANISRVDQYLYPFYTKEIEEGTLTETQAQELLECLWIKMAEIIFVVSEESAAFFSGYVSFHGMTIGGVDDGSQNAQPYSQRQSQ